MIGISRRVVLAGLAILPILPRPARATWSIVVLDRTHHWIGVAGASCTPDVYGIMSLRPGEGVLIAQAIGFDPAIQRANQLLASGTSSDSLLRAVTASTLDSVARFRQYAVATFAGGLAQFTGDSTASYHGERRDGDVLVQGNSLPGPAVLDDAMRAVQSARVAGRPLYDALMAGLAAGAAAGGDVRCGAQRATSAFLVVARPGERPFLPYLTLAVFGADRGTVDAVDLLAARLARWIASGGPRDRLTNDGVQPPPRDTSGVGAVEDAVATTADSDWVGTPAGLFHRSCVHEIPDGAMVRNDTVYRRDGTSYAVPACRFKARPSMAVLYGPSRVPSASGPLSTSPNFMARVLDASDERVDSPPLGPYSQVDMVVAIAPATEGNAVVIVDSKVPVFRRHGAEPLIRVTADSIALGDELEVWHNGPSSGSIGSPPDTPMYYAIRIVIRR